MKVKIIFGLIILVLTVSVNYAQEFTLITTKSNLVASKASIDLPGLSGNPQAIIVATPLGDTASLNPHAIGVWFYNGKWNIFNTDHATMPEGLKFKLQIFLKPGENQFLHIISKQNLGEEGSYMDHPLLNNNPNVQFKILQNYAPDNRAPYNLNPFEAKAVYNTASGKWYIKNINGKSLYQNQNTAYNIVISSDAKDTSNNSSISPAPSPTPNPTPAVSSSPPVTPIAAKTPSVDSTTACTKEIAYQTTGKWSRQKKDDLVMADRNFPKDQFKPVLAKAQLVIDLFMRLNPEFKGIEASAMRTIRGDSYLPNGALPFGIDIGYGSYICLGNDNPVPELRGKVILRGGYGFTIVYFNSLRDVIIPVQEGNPFLTTDGEEIFGFKKTLGEFKGFTMIQPGTAPRDGGNHEAVIITPDNRLPYKHVTREQYLQARIKNYQSIGGFTYEIASLKSAIENLSAAERQAPAIILDLTATPGRAKLFAAESEGGKHLVTINKDFFDPKLPRDAIQFITVHWSWYDNDVPKAEVIRQLKQNFDFQALKQMLGK